MTGWTADSESVTADSLYWTADGGPVTSPSAAPYQALITSEHNQKPNFMAMVGLITGALGDTTAVVQSMPAQFDLDAAIGAQLDVIGLWVGQSRIIPDVLIYGFFGFADDPAAKGFGELSNPSIGGIWYELGESFEGSTVLTDPDYRTIIRARIVRNQSNGTVSAIEQGLQYIFGVPSTVQDNGTLSINLNIASPLTPTDQSLLSVLDILPRPAGVAIGSITYAA